jgi:hypothetical protein
MLHFPKSTVSPRPPDNIGSISLENISADLRARFVGGIALQRVCGLAELEIVARTEAASGGEIGSAFKDYVGLIQAEIVAEHIVGTEDSRGRRGG